MILKEQKLAPRNCKITDAAGNVIPDAPVRGIHRSYMDCFANPMKASFDNCFIRSRLGVDPITGLPVTIFDEQINREKQLLESLGELVILFRERIIPDQTQNPGYRRCPFCFDGVRLQARTNCPICNGFGIMTTDPNIPRINGYELLMNPERDDRMFFVNEGMTPQKLKSQDKGLMVEHNLHFWTVPIRNCDGEYVNIVSDRDILIRYMFDRVTKTPIRELGRYIMTNVSYSLAVDNQLLHMEFDAQRVDPGIIPKIYALPNFLS